MNPSPDILAYYASPGPFTDPGEHAHLFDDLPTSPTELCQVVQNNLLHIFWAERYGRSLTEEEKETVNVRQIDRKLALIHQVNPRPLAAPRAKEERQIGNCRDFTMMLTAILRHQGIPARARCGFGAYFMANHLEDHWVCEYWNAEQNRWVLVDAQLDAFQCKELGVTFDPLDVPRNQFVVAGQAWQMCRHGQFDPQNCGIFEWRGWWFIWGNIIRELLAFNKIELLPWDYLPGCMTHEMADPLPDDPELAFYDGIAALTLAGDLTFSELRAIYDGDARFLVPPEILK
jgi:hypothetical protein